MGEPRASLPGRVPTSGTQHRIRFGDYEAVVAGVGASLRLLTCGGRDLIVPFEADQVSPVFRGATLVPWPNRVIDGRYEFGGAQHQLALTEPARGHALHGLATWQQFECRRQSSDSVTLVATIEAQAGYPWRLLVETVFSLHSDGLTQTVRATNLSSTPAPFGTGAHPYLVAGGGRVDDWTFELPADQVLLAMGERLIPASLVPVSEHPERFDFRRAHPIGPTELDHAFSGLTFADGKARQGSPTPPAAGCRCPGTSAVSGFRCTPPTIRPARLPVCIE